MLLFFAVYSQSAGFGLPASFSWLDKYRDQLSKESNSNPFANDIFDPLGYMKINESGPKKTAGEFDISFTIAERYKCICTYVCVKLSCLVYYSVTPEGILKYLGTDDH